MLFCQVLFPRRGEVSSPDTKADTHHFKRDATVVDIISKGRSHQVDSQAARRYGVVPQ